MYTSARLKFIASMIFREQLPRAANERFTDGVLVRAGRFADEHQFRLWIADAEDDLRAGLRTDARALCAGEHRPAQGGETLRLGACRRLDFARLPLGLAECVRFPIAVREKRELETR